MATSALAAPEAKTTVKDEQPGGTGEQAGSGLNSKVRVALSLGIVALVAAYSVGVVSGLIIDARKIDATHFTLIVVAAVVATMILRPDLVERLRKFKFMALELELEQVKQKQSAQQELIQDIRMVLPLLIPQPEKLHLYNLADKNTQGYRGNHTVRTELRRLRSIGLIRMVDGHRVSDIKTDLVVDLARYVELTPSGETWVQRLRKNEDPEAPPEG
jgi:hypothetical protein